MNQRGEQRPSAKLTEGDVLEIRYRHENGESLADLARRFSQVSKVNLHHIVNRRRWGWLA